MDYNSIAKSYNELHSEEQLKKLSLIEIYLREHKINLKNKKILDIGSGTGISTKFFGENAVGLEPSKEMIEEGNYTALQGEAENLPLKDHSFDVIVSITAFHNFKDPEKAIKEMHRVLRERHLVIITILKKSQDFDKLVNLLRNSFRITEEIEEAKDIILISNNL